MTKNNAKIREFLPTDIDAIYMLERKCFRKELQLSYHKIMEMLQHPDVVAYIIENEEQQVIGAFYLKLEKFINQLWILGLNIDPEYRRKGIGTMALKTIFSMAVYLHVREIRAQFEASNEAAIQFFSLHDFEPIKKLQDFFVEGIEGVEISKQFRRSENS